MNTCDPSILETLNRLSSEEMKQRAQRVQLESFEESQIEQQLFLALLNTEKDTEPTQDVPTPMLHWTWIARLFQQPMAWGATVLLIGLTSASWSLFQPSPVRHKLIRKGGKASTKKEVLALQIGQWNPKRKRIDILHSGKGLSNTDSIVFGIKLTSKNGYLYIYHHRSQKTELIHPLSPENPELRTPKPYVQLLHQTGSPQAYELNNEKGQQDFLALLTKRPLTTQEIKSLAQTYRAQGSLTESLRVSQLHKVVHGSTTFTLIVGENK